MLSYPIDEAEELLAKRLAIAKQNLDNCLEDQEFLREQITVRLSPLPAHEAASAEYLGQG